MSHRTRRNRIVEVLLTCHPRLREWLDKKHQIDPNRLFQSDWYQHLLGLTGGEAP